MKKMTPSEIKETGYKALLQSLGIAGTLRFLQQMEIGKGDYTSDRHQIPEPSITELEEYLASVTTKDYQ